MAKASPPAVVDEPAYPQPHWAPLEANQHQRVRTARQLGITREGLYKKRPTLTGIARMLRNRGHAGIPPKPGAA